MRRRVQVLLIAAVIAGASAVAGCLLWPREPSYGGRRLTVWLRDFEAEQVEKRATAAEAVKHIGSNAVPFLVERLRSPNPALRKEPQWERWKRSALAWLSKHSRLKVSPGRRPDPRHRALAALDALGREAKDALPALERLLREDPPDPQALYVIARIGPAGLPLLTRMLTNDVKILRLEARVCMEMIKSHSASLYGSIGFGPEAATFERRICEFNVKTLTAAFKEYAAQHPELAFPKSIVETPPPSPLPPDIVRSFHNGIESRMTNRPKAAGGHPASRFE
jgi:hypothetical protein